MITNELRPATKADLPMILVLGEDMYKESRLAQFAPYEPKRVAEILYWLVNNDGGFLHVSEDEHGINGFMLAILSPAAFGDYWEATELAFYVVPEKRESNIGTQILEAYKDWGKSAGATRIAIQNSSYNDPEPIAKFFVKHGFEKWGGVYSYDVKEN